MRIIKKKLLKSTLAKVMAASMVVTMIPAPVNVSAEDGNIAALTELATSGTVTLSGNVDYSANWTLTGNTTLDLNGKTITFNDGAYIDVGEYKLTIEDNVGGGKIQEKRDGTADNPVISVGKRDVAGTGVLELISGSICNDYGYGISFSNGGQGYIKGGEIHSLYSALTGNNLQGDMNLYVSNGILDTKVGPCIYMPSQLDLVIGTEDGSKPTLNGGVSVRMGKVTINDGIITAMENGVNVNSKDYPIDSPAVEYNNQNSWFPDAFFVMGGTYTSKSATNTSNDLILDIKGGTFNCDNGKGSAVAIYDFGAVAQNMTVNITGGNFNKAGETTNYGTNITDDKSRENRDAFDILTLNNIFGDSGWKDGYNKESIINTNKTNRKISIKGGTFSKLSEEDTSYIPETGYCLKGEGTENVTVGEHVPAIIAAKEAAAGTPGNITYKKCGNCGKCYIEDEEIEEENTKLYQLSLGTSTGKFTASFAGNKTTASYGYYQGASLTIKPDEGYSFGTAPTVTSSLAGLKCTTSEKQSDGSYICTVATGSAVTLGDASLTVSTSGIATDQYNVTTDLSGVSNADVEITKNGTSFGENGKVTINDTLTIKVTPKTGYKFQSAPSVTALGSQNCTISAPAADGLGYSYTVKGFEGNCNIIIKATADLVKYTVSLDRSGIKETDADVKFVINGADALSTSVKASPLDKIQLVVTPKAGRVFENAPVVKNNDSKSVAGTAVAEDGSYKYTIHSLTGDTSITVSGTAKAASHKVTLAGTVKLANAVVSLDLKEVTDNGTAKVVITPDDGYKITSNIKDIKAVLKDGSVCTVSEAEAGANGTFIITLSGIKSDVEITSVTAKTDIAKIVEAGTDTSVNVNEANLSNTFNIASVTDEEKKVIEANQNEILTAVKSVIGSATTSSVIFFNGAEALGEKEKEALVAELKTAVESGTVALSIEVTEQKLDGVTQATVTAEINKKVNNAGVNEKVTAGKVYPLDISLFAQVISSANQSLKNIKQKVDTTGKGKIKIQMSIPSDIPAKGTDVKRTYYILRFHDGKVETIPCTEKNGKLEFDSDKFSTYVLYYTDTTTVSNDNNNSNNGYIPGPGTSVSPSPIPTVTPSATPGTNPSTAPGTSPSATPGTVPTQVPGTEPTKEPGTEPTKEPGTEPTQAPGTEPTAKPAASVKVGKKVTVSGSKYKVTATGTNRAVTFTGSKSVKSVTIPASIKISGKAYKVTAIANNAFKGNKKLAKVTIGANVKKIGKNAFKGCSNLKKIIIKTKKLTAKTVGKNAFKGINKKAVVKAPKNKIKSYNKIIKAKGAGKGVKVK